MGRPRVEINVSKLLSQQTASYQIMKKTTTAHPGGESWC